MILLPGGLLRVQNLASSEVKRIAATSTLWEFAAASAGVALLAHQFWTDYMEVVKEAKGIERKLPAMVTEHGWRW